MSTTETRVGLHNSDRLMIGWMSKVSYWEPLGSTSSLEVVRIYVVVILALSAFGIFVRGK